MNSYLMKLELLEHIYADSVFQTDLHFEVLDAEFVDTCGGLLQSQIKAMNQYSEKVSVFLFCSP